VVFEEKTTAVSFLAWAAFSVEQVSNLLVRLHDIIEGENRLPFAQRNSQNSRSL
jgi:hypothetical protein